MKRFLIGLSLVLAACTTQTGESMKMFNATLPDTSTTLTTSLGPAPELTSDAWLNVDSPLRLADLRGKVVALEMWTFG